MKISTRLFIFTATVFEGASLFLNMISEYAYRRAEENEW